MLSQGAQLVTANSRLARDLRRKYDLERQERGDRVWDAPTVLSWEVWLSRRWRDAVLRDGAGGLTLLNTAQERCCWEQIIEASPEGEALIHTRGAAASVAEAWRIAHEWDVPLEAAQFVGFQDAEAFLAWAGAFQRRCRENGWLSGPELLPYLGARLRGGDRQPAGKLLLAGFDEFTTQQERWLQALTAIGWQVERVDEPVAGEPHSVARMGFRDAAEETRAAANWARDCLERKESARIGVVVPDLERSRRSLDRIFADVLGRDAAFHVSLGPPLADVPLAAAALAVLGLARPEPLAEVGALLRSPFLAGGQTELAARAGLDAELRRRGLAEVSLKTLLGAPALAQCPQLATALRWLHTDLTALAKRERPSGWSRAFAHLLHRAGWPGERPLDSAEHQAAQRWSRLLSEFAALDAMLPALDMSEAHSRLRSMAFETRFTPGNEGAPVQIMGTLEAAGASFDHLWVMGIEDSTWPPAPSPNPFLPLPLQRARRAPRSSPERELEWARRVIGRLLASAPEVVCSYPLRAGDADLRPSPLIAHLPERAGPPQRMATAAALRQTAALEEQEDSTGPPLPAGALLRGGTRIFERQAACPFSAFAEHRLHARPLEQPVLGLSPLERGRSVHRALELIWKELRSHAGLMRRTPADLAELVRRSIAAALIQQLHGRGAESLERIQALEQRRLERLLGLWLEVEKGRAPFEVVDRERARTVEIGGVRVQIQADRVDRVFEGVAIVDYKTSAVRLSDWEGDRPDAPQLPLYAVTDPSPVAAVMVAQVTPGDLTFKGLAEDERVAPGATMCEEPLADCIAAWRTALTRLGEEFARGEAAVSPKRPGQACRFCALNALCRIADAPRRIREDAP